MFVKQENRCRYGNVQKNSLQISYGNKNVKKVIDSKNLYVLVINDFFSNLNLLKIMCKSF